MNGLAPAVAAVEVATTLNSATPTAITIKTIAAMSATRTTETYADLNAARTAFARPLAVGLARSPASAPARTDLRPRSRLIAQVTS